MSVTTVRPASASGAEVELEPSDYLDFDLMIEAGDGGYTARVVESPAGEARSEFTRPFTDLELENFVLNIFSPGTTGGSDGLVPPSGMPLCDSGRSSTTPFSPVTSGPPSR